MKIRNRVPPSPSLLLVIVLALVCLADCAFAQSRPLSTDPLEDGFRNPPTSARLRAYWWWLNGNVTKAAITRDLEAMKAKGFGGALICDAGGAEQDGNDTVPHGPTFFTPEWRELFKHTLREADRLGLEMSLNIQSGWNLGGPVVKPEDAAKKLVWSEASAAAPANELRLPEPKHHPEFYRDLFVVGYRLRAPAQTNLFAGISASSEQPGHSALAATDGETETFWASSGSAPGEGPSRKRPQWLRLEFKAPISVTRLALSGRPGYGPKDCELQASMDGKQFRSVRSFSLRPRGETAVEFSEVTASVFRLLIFSALDPRVPDSPRNVQIAELSLSGKNGKRFGPTGASRRPIQNWAQKAMYGTLHFSAPDTSPLFEEFPAAPGEEDTHSAEVLDLTGHLGADGVLRWRVPSGEWKILRFGCTIGDHSQVSTSSDGWKGYALDVLDAGAFQRYWDAVLEPLIADAGPLAGRTLKYLHTDSWEVEAINWTPTLRAEFRARRGYDMLPYLPILAGRIVDSRSVSDRFLHDFRKTLGDLAVDHHYKPFRENAHRHGLQIHPESGGPHAVPIDAQRCLGQDDAPMSEFWAWSWRHRVGDSNRFFVKQPASAAHTYGHRLVLAEGFTTIGPHWQETLWDNLKPSFDQAACEGLNLLVWHAFVCSPAEMGMPGIQYFAGTHLNPNSTWWQKGAPFFAYLNRCQFLLQQGLFVADACYYYGDHVPNFAQLKRTDPARVLPGFDYDVVTEEVLLNRMKLSAGRLVLPDGMSYRLLVLPKRTQISLPILRKLKQLVDAGATILGPQPEQTESLTGYPKSEAEAARLAGEIWNGAPRRNHGRVISGKTAREVLLEDGVKPDFECAPAGQGRLDYVHRCDGPCDIYFVANRTNGWVESECSFRAIGRVPELFDPLTGQIRQLNSYSSSGGQTRLPLQFAPYGSMFIVFRKPAASPEGDGRNFPALASAQEITGPWAVKFDPKWGGPALVEFDQLVNWTKRPEEGIRYFSGTANYEKTFDLPQSLLASNHGLVLDLGDVKQLAEVRLNGKNLGILWATPFRVDVTSALKAKDNRLEIDVVNFWPNRIIGDQFLPPEKRFTRTNIRKLTKETALMDSGLLGPVRLLAVQP